MALTVSEPESSSFTPCPAGTYPARCVLIADLGTQESDYQGETKRAAKLFVQFEICEPETRREDGKAFCIGKRFTASLHEKAGLRKTLESWRGRPFSPDELRGFSLVNVLGKPCLLSVVQETKGDRTYSNIASIMGLPKGMSCQESSNQPIAFDLANPDWIVFEKLPEWLQEQIAASPEFKQAREGVTTSDFADDIPF